MFLFLPRSLCALKRVAARAEHSKFGATMGIRLEYQPGLYRAEATDGRRAIIVQGPLGDDAPWPGFKEMADDACEAIILPKDLERACKVGDDFARLGVVGLATVGNQVYLGLGNDVINTRAVEGRFPKMDAVIPKKRPLFTVRVDPRMLADTLLAIADLLPETDRAVQLFYYGDGVPLGFCAANMESGMMIDALVVPLVTPKAKEQVQDAPRVDTQEAKNPPPREEASEAKPKAKRAPKKGAQAAASEPTAQTPEAPEPPAVEAPAAQAASAA